MLRKDELAFFKANSQLDFTAALLMELWKAMGSSQKRKSVVHGGTVTPRLEAAPTTRKDRLHNSRASARPMS